MSVFLNYLLAFFEIIFFITGFSFIPYGFDFRSSLLLFGIGFTIHLIRWAIKRADNRKKAEYSVLPKSTENVPPPEYASAPLIHNCPRTIPASEFLIKYSDAYIAFDLETTGLSPAKDAIIEIGALKILDGVVLDQYSQLINPGFPIPAAASSVNHITDDMVEGMPGIQKALVDFLVFAGDWPCIAHNVSFDRSFLVSAADRCGLEIQNCFADSLQMARICFPDLPNKKLTTVCKAIGYQIGQAHRALDDAKAVHEIVKACTNQNTYL